jgi:putative PIN family toxin of toxin-antitoxin system
MPSNDPLPRAVVDTSVVVSGVMIGRGAPLALIEGWHRGAFRWLTTPTLLREYDDVLHRPRLLASSGARSEEVDAFLRLVTIQGEEVTAAANLPITLRDPNDEMVLAAAIGGRADFLVTGDRDLLSVAADPLIAPLHIVPVAAFVFLLDL